MKILLDQKKLLSVLYGTLILFLLTLTLSVLTFAFTYSSKTGPDSYRTFTVTADAKAVSAPDLAEFSYTIFTEGKPDELKKIEKENSDKVAAVLDFLLNAEVDEKDIKTENYSVEPKYRYFQCNSDGTCKEPEITGYKIIQTTAVKVRDLDKVGELLAGVTNLEVNSISRLNFSLEDKVALENQARAEAIKKAKSKAEITAKSGDFRLGKLINVSESFGGGILPYYGGVNENAKMATMDVVSEEVSETVVSTGSQEVVINVVLTYSIK